MGLENLLDPMRIFQYKIVTTVAGSLELARSLTAIIRAIYGKSRKCLVLDLDNTLWGGVIGDDGPDKIRIGKETAEAEAYTAFQEYCLRLRARGVLLAVCSKNTDAIARQGLPPPRLRFEDSSTSLPFGQTGSRSPKTWSRSPAS